VARIRLAAMLLPVACEYTLALVANFVLLVIWFAKAIAGVLLLSSVGVTSVDTLSPCCALFCAPKAMGSKWPCDASCTLIDCPVLAQSATVVTGRVSVVGS
jgi:hypothetical protein